MKKWINICFILLILILPLITSQNTFQNKTNEKLNKDLDFTGENLFRGFFNISSEETLNITKVVIILEILILIILMLLNIKEIIPFFEGWRFWVFIISISFLISISGAINKVANILLKFAGIFKKIEEWSLLSTALVILIILALFYAINKLIMIMKKSIKISKAEQAGAEAGMEIKKLRLRNKHKLD